MLYSLVGFTAWSSTRDPAQVFVLLETLYGEFDAIARRSKFYFCFRRLSCVQSSDNRT